MTSIKTSHRIVTASWFTTLPLDHLRVSISRGIPRPAPAAGFRVYRKLAPDAWFNSVSTAEYLQRYRAEVLDLLDPRQVADAIADMARGRVAVLLCFERPGSGAWCHRSIVATWLAEATGQPVPEVGFETLPQSAHPLLPPLQLALGAAP